MRFTITCGLSIDTEKKIRRHCVIDANEIIINIAIKEHTKKVCKLPCGVLRANLRSG